MALVRAVTVLPLVAVMVLVTTPASAHVSVKGAGARQGEAATLTFRVPTERKVATTAVRVVLPPEARITAARPAPTAGWTAALSQEGQFVTAVTWTATAGGIPPEQAATFVVRLAPLPFVPRLVLGTLQTYADGEVVRWVETSQGAEHPAPVLVLGPPLKPSPTTAPTSSPSPASFPAADDDEGIDRGALTGIGFALLAAVLAAVLLLRRRGA